MIVPYRFYTWHCYMPHRRLRASFKPKDDPGHHPECCS